MSTTPVGLPDGRLPLLRLLRPGRHGWYIVAALAAATAAGWALERSRGWQLWQAVALGLAALTPAFALKWRADAVRWGATASIAGALVVVQGLHTVEHVAQWWQRHVMGLPLRLSNGLLSPANSEWVHFVWNWLVVVVVLLLVRRGMRNPWTWVLVVYALAHALEHTYLFARFLMVTRDLSQLGFPNVTAQGLPGVVGRDGWLDRTRPGALEVVCRLPFVTTATRLDTHAAWNAGEVTLTLLAVNQWLRRGARALRPPVAR
jgi:hypothetical protein